MIELNASSEFSFIAGSSGLGRVADGFVDGNVVACSATTEVYIMRLQGRRVAVKRLRQEFCDDATLLAAYAKEYEIGCRLRHPSLPIYIDYQSSITGDTYIVMEYVDGVTLSQFLTTDEGVGYFADSSNARIFFSALIDVVAYLHRNGVVHCDIKADNIMLRGIDRGPVLVDFDKCYIGHLDRTHGGTRDASDPTPQDVTPDASTDYRAIGRVYDKIALSVDILPKMRLDKFRKMCDSPSVTYEALADVLERNGRSVLWRWCVLTAVVAAIVIAAVFMLDVLKEREVVIREHQSAVQRMVLNDVQSGLVDTSVHAPI